MSRKNHKFDYITDTCTICGVVRRKIPYVGTGYNMNLRGMSGMEYSTDGIKFQKEFIDCKKWTSIKK